MRIQESLRSIQRELFAVVSVLLILQLCFSYMVVQDMQKEMQGSVESETTKTYNDVLRTEKYDKAIETSNGLAYKTKRLGATYYVVIDNKWLAKKKPGMQERQAYIQENKWSMTFRTLWISNKAMTMLIVTGAYAILGALFLRVLGKMLIANRIHRNAKVLGMEDDGTGWKKEKQSIYSAYSVRLRNGYEFRVAILLFGGVISYFGYAINATDEQTLALFGWFVLLMVLVGVKCEKDMRLDMEEEMKQRPKQ
ncbi:hypothetical protein B4086_5495 [Bacillus cereus]|nr:hypothetical protein B4086_5495 [Bacillus cereus]